MPSFITEKMLIAKSTTPRAVFHMKFDETGADIAALYEDLRGSKITANALDTWTDSGAGEGILVDTITNTAGAVTECPLPRILDTESALLIACCQPQNNLAATVQFGDASNNDTLSLVCSTNANIRALSTAGDTGTLSLDQDAAIGTDFMSALCIDRAAGVLRGYSQSGTGSVVETATTTTLGAWSGTTLSDELNFAGATGVASMLMYSLTLYKWTGPMPSDIATALEYFATNMKAGTKTLYSGWDSV